MSHSLNSLKGVIHGTTTGVIKRDTRRLGAELSRRALHLVTLEFFGQFISGYFWASCYKHTDHEPARLSLLKKPIVVPLKPIMVVFIFFSMPSKP